MIDELIQNKQLNIAYQVINENVGFQIADFLHLLKNARSRLLNANVVINPTNTNDSVQYFELMKDPEINDLIKDTSSLAKLRDELPKNLFCFTTMFRIIEKYSFSTFLYFFIYSLWNESIFNNYIGPQTRKYFLLITLDIFNRIKTFYESKTFDQNVFEKKSKDHPFVSMVTKDKIPRIINTLVAIIKEIEECIDDNLGLSRLGSHPIENFIGRIRSLCHMDNRFETVLHNVARYELIVRDFKKCYLKFKPRHNSPGGTNLKQTGNELEFIYQPDQIVDWIFEYIGINEKTQNNQLIDFLEKLRMFAYENPYSKVKLPLTTSNIAIIQRMYVQSTLYGIKVWEPREIDMIDSLLLTNNEKKIYSNKSFNCSKQDKQIIIKERKSILQDRNWSKEEDDFIVKYIQKKISLKELRSLLILRENKKIMERKNFLIESRNIQIPKPQFPRKRKNINH